ncbi:hypothetical protein Tco_0446402 [Tanacetum coccineum]
MVVWFLGLENVLSWLLAEGKRDAIIVNINVIALFKQGIGSSPARNVGTTSPEMDVGMIVDDEVLHKMISMVEKNNFVEELMIVVVDTEQNV